MAHPYTHMQESARQAKVECGTKAAESVATAGTLARATAKCASSSTLQSTIVTFAEYEKTVVSTGEMLKRIGQGCSDLDELLDDVATTLTTSSERRDSLGNPLQSIPLAEQ